jgi:hypothetical protein
MVCIVYTIILNVSIILLFPTIAFLQKKSFQIDSQNYIYIIHPSSSTPKATFVADPLLLRYFLSSSSMVWARLPPLLLLHYQSSACTAKLLREQQPGRSLWSSHRCLPLQLAARVLVPQSCRRRTPKVLAVLLLVVVDAGWKVYRGALPSCSYHSFHIQARIPAAVASIVACRYLHSVGDIELRIPLE